MARLFFPKQFHSYFVDARKRTQFVVKDDSESLNLLEVFRVQSQLIEGVLGEEL